MRSIYWLGVVGSRQRHDRKAIQAAIRQRVAELRAEGHDQVGIVSGGARGPDRYAELVAEADGLPLEVKLPNLEGLGGGAPRWAWANRYHARNREIAQRCHELVAAVAPSRTGGTEQTIREAKKAGKPIRIIGANGSWLPPSPS